VLAFVLLELNHVHPKFLPVKCFHKLGICEIRFGVLTHAVVEGKIEVVYLKQHNFLSNQQYTFPTCDKIGVIYYL